MKYGTYSSALIVKPTTEPIFSEMATTIGIEDEAGGCFVVVSQEGGEGIGKIHIDREEWPQIRDAVEKMFTICDQINRECMDRKPEQP